MGETNLEIELWMKRSGSPEFSPELGKNALMAVEESGFSERS